MEKCCQLIKMSPLLTSLSLCSCSSMITKNHDGHVENGDSNKPNVVFILADDLGYADISCLGQTKFSTPNIDKLASQGKLFTQHYAGSSVSAPSRCSLITGLHTGHTYIRGNKELPIEGQHPLPSDTYTIFKLFKDNGYKTAVFGKWGLGAPNTEGAPENQNVDEFFGYNCQRMAHNYYPYYLWHNDEKVFLEGNINHEENDYAPSLIHSEALDFIVDNKDTSFFMFYTTVLPHAELKVPEEQLSKFVGNPALEEEKAYIGCDDGPHYKKGGYGSQQFTHAAFAAMVSLLDKHVGELCATLDSLGIAENTIIVFTSDNGPHAEGGAEPLFFDSNGPLRGIKRDLYEGGIRVPMIIRWDKMVENGTKSTHISAFWDFLPTFADILNDDNISEVDGLSFLPELTEQNTQEKHDFLYWEFHENNGRQAVRKDNWKAVKYDVLNDGKIELYELSSDPSESHDVSEQYPEVAKMLDSLMNNSRTESDIFSFK